MARHLPPGMHTRVGAPRHGQSYYLTQALGKGLLDHSLHRTEARLDRPARELRAVVLEQQPRGQGYPRLRATISRYSTSSEKAPSPPAHSRTTPCISSRICA